MSEVQINWNSDGLVAAIIQAETDGRVLMLGWMNEESLKLSLQKSQTVFYSRSRQQLWHKGATSGNFQDIVSIEFDCDADALLIKVREHGPACHNGTRSCFDTGRL